MVTYFKPYSDTLQNKITRWCNRHVDSAFSWLENNVISLPPYGKNFSLHFVLNWKLLYFLFDLLKIAIANYELFFWDRQIKCYVRRRFKKKKMYGIIVETIQFKARIEKCFEKVDVRIVDFLVKFEVIIIDVYCNYIFKKVLSL